MLVLAGSLAGAKGQGPRHVARASPQRDGWVPKASVLRLTEAAWLFLTALLSNVTLLLPFFFFFCHIEACGIWDLSSPTRPGMEPVPPAQSPNHWTAREVSAILFTKAITGVTYIQREGFS